MPPDVSGVGVAAAEAFAPFAGMLPSSPRTPQAVQAVEIRTREAMMRTRHGVSIPGHPSPNHHAAIIRAEPQR
jgi:hypothetical protein